MYCYLLVFITCLWASYTPPPLVFWYGYVGHFSTSGRAEETSYCFGKNDKQPPSKTSVGLSAGGRYKQVVARTGAPFCHMSVQSQKAVTAHFSSEQLLPFHFAQQCACVRRVCACLWYGVGSWPYTPKLSPWHPRPVLSPFPIGGGTIVFNRVGLKVYNKNHNRSRSVYYAASYAARFFFKRKRKTYNNISLCRGYNRVKGLIRLQWLFRWSYLSHRHIYLAVRN